MADVDGANDRLETGVPHLDRVLGGGLLRGTLALVIGAPGTGKTVLAQQMVFHHAVHGGSALFLTGYSETHDKLLRHSRGLSFFRPELIGTKVQFASLLDLLQAGADETEDAIVAMARAQNATLVVLDGFKGMRQLLPDEQASARFLYSLSAKLALLGATTIVVAEGNPDEPSRYSEITVCDVILALEYESSLTGQRRTLKVVKARGSAPLPGAHVFVINSDGLAVFPRIESVVGAIEPTWPGGRMSIGSPGLDALMGGGPNVGTSTLVIGSPGAGKTLLGLSFAAEGARLHEPSLIVSFIESPAQLRALGEGFGINLDSAGDVRILALPSYDLEADELAQMLFQDVERRGVRRLVIDSVFELGRAIGDERRRPSFMAALVRYLRSRHITTYFTLETPTIVGPELDLGGTAVSVVAENALVFRNVEYLGRLHRVVSVLKMRFSDHDRALHEYAISATRGFHLEGPAPLGEGLLTGNARSLAVPPPFHPPNEGQKPS